MSDFYKHYEMADGHLNKCKKCMREYAKMRYEIKSKDPDWMEKERERSRLKYYNLGRNEKQSCLDAGIRNKVNVHSVSCNRNILNVNTLKKQRNVRISNNSMSEGEMNEVEYAINSQKVRIKKCCASCLHKGSINDTNYRKCMLSGKKVTSDFLCLSWHISAEMDRFRIGGK